MATSAKLSIPRIQESAKFLETKETELRAAMQNIINAVGDLPGHYAGVSFEEYKAKMEPYTQHFQRALGVIQQFIQFENDYAQKWNSTEEENRNSYASIKPQINQ